ncbi:MAG: RidA family protein [Alphaproteobacteria bacterium]
MAIARVISKRINEPKGRFSNALRVGDLLFISGQTGRLPDGAIGCKGDVVGQTRLALSRIQALCEAAGARMTDILRLGIFSVQIADLDKIYSLWDEFFPGPPYPTDTFIGNVRLADPELLVEIEATVAIPKRAAKAPSASRKAPAARTKARTRRARR